MKLLGEVMVTAVGYYFVIGFVLLCGCEVDALHRGFLAVSVGVFRALDYKWNKKMYDDNW